MGLACLQPPTTWPPASPPQVACAVLARLRVPPQQWTTGLRFLHARWLAEMGSMAAEIEKGLRAGKQETAEGAALAARMGFPNLGEGLAQLKAALAKGDHSQLQRWQAYILWHKLGAWAAQQRAAKEEEGAAGKKGGDTAPVVGKSFIISGVIADWASCPETAVLAMLVDLANTHPPTDARVARIEQLASQLPMLQRAAAPPVEVGGRFEAASMAQVIADRAEAQRRADAAKQGLRAAQQSAQKQSRGAAQQAARQRAPAGLQDASHQTP